MGMGKKMNTIRNQRFGEERALYHMLGGEIVSCRFEGEEDGESALKESRNVAVRDCLFDLRYPFWHGRALTISDCELTERCRAALWYSRDIKIENSRLHGIKALRECENALLSSCDVISPEFGWRSHGVTLTDTKIVSEYAFFEGRKIRADHLTFGGKYSFQYVRGAVIRDSTLDTKDAFWHTDNVTVYDSEIRGEYLGWYSRNLTLIRCKISGTQPLCYCRNLKLIDCETEGCDLAFECSDVHADIRGNIDSVKNPRSGRIVADSIGSIIREDCPHPVRAKVLLRP